MKKALYTKIILAAVLTSGCGSAEIVVPIEQSLQIEEVDEVATTPSVEVGDEGGDQLEPVTKNQQSLVITDRLTDWGFTQANRSADSIDTVIVHSVYNPFTVKVHDLGKIIEIFKGYGVAPHYIITRDGQIHRLVLDKDIAYHAGRSRVPDGRTAVNDFSIGIEMIASLEDTYTREQYQSLKELTKRLGEDYGIKYVLGHDEIAVVDPWNFDWSQINDLRHEPRTQL